jgi:hypothetical protein
MENFIGEEEIDKEEYEDERFAERADLDALRIKEQ